MPTKKRRRYVPPPAPWSPMEFDRKIRVPGDPERGTEDHVAEVWGNDRYTATVRRFPNGSISIGFHRHDRAPVRDWRQVQKIKNEIAGPEREAMELYPAESRKVDEANEYHIWVLPEGERFPIGSPQRFVAYEMPAEYAARGARQRAEDEEFQ